MDAIVFAQSMKNNTSPIPGNYQPKYATLQPVIAKPVVTKLPRTDLTKIPPEELNIISPQQEIKPAGSNVRRDIIAGHLRKLTTISKEREIKATVLKEYYRDLFGIDAPTMKKEKLLNTLREELGIPLPPPR